MGLDANYPAVEINNESIVPVWNGVHTIIGWMGPSPYMSAHANVTCTLKRWNGRWYKLLNASGWDIPSASAYVSAARTHLSYGSPQGYVLGPCENNTDQPGRSLLSFIVDVAALVLLVALWRRVRALKAPNRALLEGPSKDAYGLE